MRNIFSIVLSVFLLIFSLSGCSNPDSGNSSSSIPGISSVLASVSSSSSGNSTSSNSSTSCVSTPIGYANAVTGGASADSSHIYTVTNRAELAAALAAKSSTAKIIKISGTIDLCVNDSNVSMAESDFRVSPYTITDYLTAYDPSTWGYSSSVSGTQETARAASASAQASRVVIYIGSNTTILGLGTDAKIIHGNLYIGSGVSNVIIKNIEFQDAYDYFPQWDPTDGSSGNWNSQYDCITIKGGTSVWVDHCTFDDGSRTDDQTCTYFSREYQHHDALIDITNQADLVTVSYCHFYNHDKTGLIGNSDSASSDSGKLRVTMHHNIYENVVQRCPRVRYGAVHIFNNYYKSVSSYCIAVGANSKIYIEKNYFETGVKQLSWADSSTYPGAFIDVGNSPALSTSGINSWTGTTVSWTPSSLYTYTADTPDQAKTDCLSYAGAGKSDKP